MVTNYFVEFPNHLYQKLHMFVLLKVFNENPSIVTKSEEEKCMERKWICLAIIYHGLRHHLHNNQ